MSETSLILRFATLIKILIILIRNSLYFVRPWSNNVFNTNNTFGLKLHVHLRIGFSHLKKDKLKHDFQDSVNPLCICESDIESTVYFFPHCPSFKTQGQILLSNIKVLIQAYWQKMKIKLSERFYLEEQTLFFQLLKNLLMQLLVSF